MKIKENEKLIDADIEGLVYNGRIDFSDIKIPIFIFAGSSVSMRFTSSIVKILIKNKHSYYDNYIGYIVDGVQKKKLLLNDESVQEITLGENLSENEIHEVTVFKRQDGCHEFSFYGFIIDKNGSLEHKQRRLKRRMEFYGESAAAGALVEAENQLGRICEKHNGQYMNSWDSYAMLTARNLKVEVNLIVQEGISLLDGSGYFHVPHTIGMENIYDKLRYNPDLGKIASWDFESYIPQIVVIDIGQNDSIPENYMKKNGNDEKANKWKDSYRAFVLALRSRYPDAFIILTTTVVAHPSAWDRAIGQVCSDINDDRIVHFLYSSNGCGALNCTGKFLAEQMSFELSMFIKSLGASVWNK